MSTRAKTLKVAEAGQREAAAALSNTVLNLPDDLFDREEPEQDFHHAEYAAQLDWDHRDPWDRLLAAQARLENCALIAGR